MSDFVTAHVDSREWLSALKQYEAEITNKTLPEILNKRGRNIASRAASKGFTPRATTGEIQKAMEETATRPGYGPWLFVLTNAKRKKMGLPSTGGAAISADATKFLAKRRQGVAYIASGWIPAIVKFGGHPKTAVSAHSLINKAQNKLARPGDIIAILENTAKGSGDVGFAAMQKAVDYDAKDMLTYLEGLKKTAKKYSAK